jgi:hypothetical protein
MIPVKIDETEYDYPSFQPDQILTADDLNHAFNFLDIQERLSRTNLIGIGVVCGLKVTKSSDSKSVLITKGSGVTSHGYLIVHGVENSEDPIEYRKYRTFDAKKNEKYSLFVSGNTQKYALYELIDKAHEANSDVLLDPAFLNDKVCLVFYEILKENAKNCDPTSCDDKGVKVFVNQRKLLIAAADADKVILECNTLAKATGSGEFFPGLLSLPELRLPALDVPSTKLQTSDDVYEAYQRVFTKEFVNAVADALKKGFDCFKSYLKVQNNPFLGFASQFKFLYDGTISGNALLHFQYYFDFFNDLILAYLEWKRSAQSLVAMCTPPEALFPRHLFLGLVNEPYSVEKSKYRNYFIPSPIHASHEKSYREFLLLFYRLQRMIQHFRIPQPSSYIVKFVDENIRVTPSLIGRYALGERSIPYYYAVNDAPYKLYEAWNPALTMKGKERYNLHYYPSYNNQDDFVRKPLEFDLEQYNFFRIEGHIGKKYSTALSSILSVRNEHRLPFDVIALSVDSLPEKIDPAKYPCYFEDLQALYETLWAEFMCRLCKALTCIYKIPKRASGEVTGTVKKSSLSLIKGCNDVLTYRETTLGGVFEQVHPMINKEKLKGIDTLEVVSRESLVKLLRVNIGTDKPEVEKITDDEIDSAVFFVQLVQAIVNLGDAIPEKLSAFDFPKLNTTLKRINELLRKGSTSSNAILKDLFAVNQCLRELTDLCKLAAFKAIFREYQERLAKIRLMKTFGEFAKKHPGIHHKGGVPAGGTFILVYRDLADENAKDEGDNVFSFGDLILGEMKDATIPPVKKGPSASRYSPAEIKEFTKKINVLKIKGLTNDEIEETLDIKIPEIIKGAGLFEKQLATIPGDTVIADFYLPYLCCSDCSPVQFVVNIPEPKVVFSLQKLEYCNEDKSEYPFTISPLGGKINTDFSDCIKDKGDGLFSFLPAGVKVPDGQKSVLVTFTYIKDDQSQSITVTVYAKPMVKILVTAVPSNPRSFDFFIDKPEMITSAEWKFGDGGTSTSIDPVPYNYTKSGEFSVGVTVRNGPCTSVVEEVKVTIPEPKPVEVELKLKEVCRDVKEVYFSIAPAGGKLVGEYFLEKESGRYVFFPPDVDMKGQPSRTLTFNYTSPENQSATFTITVFEKPEGFVSFDTGQSVLYLGLHKLTNVLSAKVDFGDGTSGEFQVNYQASINIPKHLYPQPGDYEVRVTLINGVCVRELKPIPVTILKADEQFVKECLPVTHTIDRYGRVEVAARSSEEFMKAYKSVNKDVHSYFTAMKEASSADGKVDPEFFNRFRLSDEWVTALPLSPAAARTLSIQMMAVFLYNIFGYMCPRTADVDDNTVKIFSSLFSKLDEIKSVNAKEKSLLAKLGEDITGEIVLINRSNESGMKARYQSLLHETNTHMKRLNEAQ